LTTQYVYGSRAGTYEKVSLTIAIRNQQSIRLSFAESRLLVGHGNSKKEWIDKLLTTYSALAEKTFSTRVSPYETQLREYGFFLIGSTRFVPSERLIVCKGQRFVVGEDRFLHSYGFIEPTRAKQTIIRRIVHKVLEESVPFLLPRIDTLTNSDVVHHLLAKHFGLQWE